MKALLTASALLCHVYKSCLRKSNIYRGKTKVTKHENKCYGALDEPSSEHNLCKFNAIKVPIVLWQAGLLPPKWSCMAIKTFILYRSH